MNKKCTKCHKKLTESESNPEKSTNPNGLCKKCWKKVVRDADMSVFEDMI